MILDDIRQYDGSCQMCSRSLIYLRPLGSIPDGDPNPISPAKTHHGTMCFTWLGPAFILAPRQWTNEPWFMITWNNPKSSEIYGNMQSLPHCNTQAIHMALKNQGTPRKSSGFIMFIIMFIIMFAMTMTITRRTVFGFWGIQSLRDWPSWWMPNWMKKQDRALGCRKVHGTRPGIWYLLLIQES